MNNYQRQFMSLEERVRSLIGQPDSATGCRIWQGYYRKRYPAINISTGRGRQVARRVSRVLWELRHGPIPSGFNVLHTCDDPRCCEETHHFLGTHADNIADMVAKGRQARAHRAMTEAQARDAFAMYQAGTYTLQMIADKYGVTIQAIWLLGKRRNWKWLHPQVERSA